MSRPAPIIDSVPALVRRMVDAARLAVEIQEAIMYGMELGIDVDDAKADIARVVEFADRHGMRPQIVEARRLMLVRALNERSGRTP